MKGAIITALATVSLVILAGIIYISQNPALPEKKMGAAEQEKPAAAEGTVKISGQEFSGPTIIYRQGQFSPGQIEVKAEQGCLLAIANESEQPLLLGLNPHQEKGDPGFSYRDIPPGESLIIDPRYRIENIAFHDHRRAQSEFSVVLGGECKDL